MRNFYIKNTGDIKTEFASFYATEDTNLGHFLIVDSTYGPDGKPSNKLRHLYAFPNHEVKKNDRIVLYTHKNTNCILQDPVDKVPQHTFYWNLAEHVWNVGGDVAHLLDVRGGLTYKAAKQEKAK